MNMLFIAYNESVCQNSVQRAEYFNSSTVMSQVGQTIHEAYNETIADYYRDTQCEGLPTWIVLLINAPFATGLALITKKMILV